jgi:hypothetical protein
MDHDALMSDLRRIAAVVDGPPEAVFAAARAAFLTRDVDGDFAVLVGDSRAAAAGTFEPVRAESPAQGHWLLSFAGGGVQVDMEVAELSGRISLVGQFTGAAGGDDYVLETPQSRHPIHVDDLGRFIVDDLSHGRIRLRCRAVGGAAITTVWVTV